MTPEVAGPSSRLVEPEGLLCAWPGCGPGAKGRPGRGTTRGVLPCMSPLDVSDYGALACGVLYFVYNLAADLGGRCSTSTTLVHRQQRLMAADPGRHRPGRSGRDRELRLEPPMNRIIRIGC